MSVDRSVEVSLAPELLWIFFPLLQKGVEVEVETGCSVKKLLTEQFGISDDYINGRISTVFLDSRAVDKKESAIVHDGSALALSGAMPGLVGATMRSGGFYAAMRGAMTHRGDDEIPAARRGRIRIKLFNLLLQELGPRLLRHGVLLKVEDLKDLLAGQPPEFRFRGCLVDGRKVPAEDLRGGNGLGEAGQKLKLKVQFGDS